MGSGAISLLPGPLQTVALAQSVKRDNSHSIPRKAVVPACLTPFRDDGQIDYADFRKHIKDVASVPGVSAIMVNGGAGHDKTLTREEKRKLLGEALKVVEGQTPIIAAVRESKACPTLEPLAQDALAEGAHALAMMPPATEAGFSWALASKRFEEVSAVNLPMVIYQTRYESEVLIRLAKEYSVIAVKEGSKDPATFEHNMRGLRALDKQVAVWSTHSKWLLADLATGADGILSGMGSFAADLQVALLEAVENSDLAEARRINDRIYPLTRVFYQPGQNAHVKMNYALKKLGRQQHGAVRPPLRALTETERSAIDKALLEGGLL